MKKLSVVLFLLLLTVLQSNSKTKSDMNNSNFDSAASIKSEILACLQAWNDAAKERDLEGFMALFDDSENIVLAGSDTGEVFKGKDRIKEWLKMLFEYAAFSWEMDRVETDYFENTAWVFMEGRMVVVPSGKEPNKTPYRFTGVLVKRNNEWKWRLFDGSVPRSH
jgi:uncharacterized protein (TIGR02246 family)